MATKKQKREAALAKRAKFMESYKRDGEIALERSRAAEREKIERIREVDERSRKEIDQQFGMTYEEAVRIARGM